MAEPRRVQLSCASSNASIHPPPPKKPRSDTQDPETSVAATVRIALTLFQPDQKKCPEFFYPELLRNLQSSDKRPADKVQKKPLDPFNDDELQQKEVEALSKKFEEKYGKQKRRRDRAQDLIDMGYGYDESDSFIDNSEAYDELVPASLNTKHGGFYINTGTLQFRQASESEDEAAREKKKKAPKKMKERGDKVKRRKREEEKKGKKSKYSKSGFVALNGSKDKKKKKLMGKLQEMMAKFEKDKKDYETWTSAALTTAAPKATSSPPTASALPPPPPREAKPAPDPSPSTPVSESKLLPAANITIKKEVESPSVPAQKGDAAKEEFKKPPSFLEGLPPAIEKKIKEFAKWLQTPSNKKKQFSSEMNAALLEVYLLCRELSWGQRSSVFGFLSSILPCSKDTLVKWASRLYMHKQSERLREPLRKLKEAVAKTMPELVCKYHAELKVYNQAKYAKMMCEDKEQKTLPKEEEDEDKGSKKAAAGPRKKFQWTEEIRQLLCQLVRMKVEIYEPETSGASSLEEYVKCFLDEEVKPLWPRGWMQARTLFKESRRLYPQLSSLMAMNKPFIPSRTKAKDSCKKPDEAVPSSSADPPAPVVSAPAAAVSTSGGSPVSAHTQDNSLDGDLIHNPPSLDGVAEHLTALSGRASCSVFEFPAPSKSSVPEKTTIVVMVADEKKKLCPPVAATSQPSARPVFHKKFMTSGLEKKTAPSVPSPKPSPQAQHPPGPAKTQAANPSVPPNVYPASKASFTHPIPSGGAKVTAPSPSQQPLAPQPKPPKPQGIPPSSSPASTGHKLIVSPAFVPKPPNNPGLAPVYRAAVNRPPVPTHTSTMNRPPVPTHTSTMNRPPVPPHTTMNRPPVPTQTSTMNRPPVPPHTSTMNRPPIPTQTSTMNRPPVPPHTSTMSRPPISTQTSTVNRPPIPTQTSTMNRPPAPPHTSTMNRPPVPPHTSTMNRPPVPPHTSTMTLNQAPSSTSRNPVTMSVKMTPRPPQKLTLMAPQDCGGGTQGVAKLLTSAMVGGNASNVGVQKSAGPGLFSPPLTILTPPYKQNGGKMSAPTSMSVLSTLNSFPLHVVSFTAEPSPKAGASKDAIVTGPAPGTYNHGLPRNLLGGLHTSASHHAAPIPHPPLSGHMQPTQTGTDGAHTHNKGALPPPMRPGRPNNP